MSVLVSGEELKINLDNYMTNSRTENCEGIKYDLTLHGRFLKAKYGQPMEYDKLSPQELNEGTIVSPGETVYVMTEETLHLPQNVYATLTSKRNMGERGINVHSALVVDPGYKGKLIFGFYNFSSSDFHLMPGRTFASAIFHELEEGEKFQYTNGKEPKSMMDFPSDLIATIKDCNPIGYTVLSNTVKEMGDEIGKIKSDIREFDNWAKEVRHALSILTIESEKANSSIINLKESLNEEAASRKAELAILDKKFSKNLIRIETIGYILVAIIVGVGGTLLAQLLIGIIQFPM